MNDADYECAGCGADIFLPDQPCPFCGSDETLETRSVN